MVAIGTDFEVLGEKPISREKALKKLKKFIKLQQRESLVSIEPSIPVGGRATNGVALHQNIIKQLQLIMDHL